MDYIENILSKIKSNYGVLIGKKSVHDLSTFVCAYELAVSDLTGIKCNFNCNFQEFVARKHKLRFVNKHWTEIISKGKQPEEAFDMFFVYWEEFKNTKKDCLLSNKANK